LAHEGAVHFHDDVYEYRRAPKRSRERWLGGVQVLPQVRWRYDPGLGRIVE
jgi:hypothetical protein